MRIDEHERIEGIPTRVARDLLKAVRLHETPLLTQAIVRDGPECFAIVDALARAGLLMRTWEQHWNWTGAPLWAVTVAGMRLGGATVRRTRRALADEAMRRFVERVTYVNSEDSPFAYRVGRVRLFGSYLTDAPDVGDIDLCVELVPRAQAQAAQDAREQQRIAQAEQAERSFPSFLARQFFPQEEVLLFLRGADRILSFVPRENVEELGVSTVTLLELPEAPPIRERPARTAEAIFPRWAATVGVVQALAGDNVRPLCQALLLASRLRSQTWVLQPEEVELAGTLSGTRVDREEQTDPLHDIMPELARCALMLWQTHSTGTQDDPSQVARQALALCCGRGWPELTAAFPRERGRYRPDECYHVDLLATVLLLAAVASWDGKPLPDDIYQLVTSLTDAWPASGEDRLFEDYQQQMLLAGNAVRAALELSLLPHREQLFQQVALQLFQQVWRHEQPYPGYRPDDAACDWTLGIAIRGASPPRSWVRQVWPQPLWRLLTPSSAAPRGDAFRRELFTRLRFSLRSTKRDLQHRHELDAMRWAEQWRNQEAKSRVIGTVGQLAIAAWMELQTQLAHLADPVAATLELLQLLMLAERVNLDYSGLVADAISLTALSLQALDTYPDGSPASEMLALLSVRLEQYTDRTLKAFHQRWL